MLTKDSVTTAIEYSNERLLTSHEDGFIRLWDVRAPQMPTNTYKAHSKLVSSVEFNPNKGQVFCSVIYVVICRGRMILLSRCGIPAHPSRFRILVHIMIRSSQLFGNIKLNL